MRRSYNIPGEDWWDDFCVHLLCCLVPVYGCIRVYKSVARLRAEIIKRGLPSLHITVEGGQVVAVAR